MVLRKTDSEIEFDEILMDSRNIHGFHKENLEGVIENPVNEKVFLALGAALAVILLLLASRVGFLQLVKGAEFHSRAENNYLKIIPVPNERGEIYDRRGAPLAYNENVGGGMARRYPDHGFLHVLGFLSNSQGEVLRGASALEAAYDEVLAGRPDKMAEEFDAMGNLLGSGILEKGARGNGLLTTIDSGLQIKISETLAKTINDYGFTGGAAVMLDLSRGEILALASSPEFDPNMLMSGAAQEDIDRLIGDPGKPFLNRAISGLYPPGSIVKPALAAAALREGIIPPDKQILSTGVLILPNQYDPLRPNVFYDWKAHGLVNMRQAIALSSNVYFYTLGGGYGDQKGLGVWNIRKYLAIFGFGEKTGVDLPGEKFGLLPDPSIQRGGRDWTIGDTYNLSIGQGDILVTPLQMAFYAAYIANRGEIFYPHLVRALVDENKQIIEYLYYPKKETIKWDGEIFGLIHNAMRDATVYGTARGLAGLGFDIAAKTGTAEIGDTARVHSWSIGFFPMDNPKIAFAILMENGPKGNLVGATYVAAEVIRWINHTNFLYRHDNDILLK